MAKPHACSCIQSPMRLATLPVFMALLAAWPVMGFDRSTDSELVMPLGLDDLSGKQAGADDRLPADAIEAPWPAWAQAAWLAGQFGRSQVPWLHAAATVMVRSLPHLAAQWVEAHRRSCSVGTSIASPIQRPAHVPSFVRQCGGRTPPPWPVLPMD
eukprot:CAMPEP_0178443586 /NCGR_PEP_ID=MMETSP0689_2-20121128/38986_1 /TAXON_ID=160604 /ORGANISM="Amphidinium massartii, Strain CS-259" /LENGTH=155 /DNA_ID=CAMNT_0020067627 /DNA_START=53 /DNA_END=521 /DNA_ORIENTATION=-